MGGGGNTTRLRHSRDKWIQQALDASNMGCVEDVSLGLARKRDELQAILDCLMRMTAASSKNEQSGIHMRLNESRDFHVLTLRWKRAKVSEEGQEIAHVSASENPAPRQHSWNLAGDILHD